MTISQKYKHTDLGLIPTDWEVVKLSEVIDNFTGLTYTPNNVKEYGILVLRSSNIQNGMLSFMDNVYVDNIDIPKRVIVQDGDILVCVRNGSKNLIGKSARIYGAHKRIMAFGAFMTILRTKNKNSNKYIHYVWQSSIIQKQIEENLGATINQITNSDINTYIIPLPPLPEQRAIAEALSDVDELITALDKKITKKRLIKQGAMQQLLTGKKRLPGFTEKWVEKKLGDICTIIMGQSPSSVHYNTQNIGLPLIQGNADLENRQQVIRFYTSEITKECEEGDIIMSVRAPVGAVGKAICRSCLGRGVCAIKSNNDFLYHYFVYTENNWGFFSKGSTFDSINSDELYQLSLILSNDINEQQAIAAILSDMDQEIANLEAQRDKYSVLKSGMMQKLLTGKIRLIKPQTASQPLLSNVIAGHIVNTLYQSQGWGRTKLQKALHLSSYYSQSDLGDSYIRNTAGPDDQSFMNQIDLKFKQYHHVEVFPKITLDGKKHYVYRPTEDIHILEKVYDGYPEITRQKIDFILSKMTSWNLAQSEIISTLYAVWNNRIIKNLPISDDLLLADFYKWSEHKSEYSSAKVLKMLDYMRKENIIPIGWGKYIEDREDW